MKRILNEMNTIDEGADLYERYVRGDESAFDKLVALYRKDLTAYAGSITKNFALAEDVAIDVFAEIVYKKGRYNGKIPFKSYLLMICRGKAIDKVRRESRYVSLPEWASDDTDVFSSVEDGEKKRVLLKAVEELPEKQRSAVYFVYYEGLSYSETAKIMKTDAKKTDNLITQAKKKLKEELKDRI